MIIEQLAGKTIQEKATIKASALSGIAPIKNESFSAGSFEVLSINPIENGGVEVFVRAKNSKGQPMGFGPDGSIETERIRIFNPPVLARTGKIITRKVKRVEGEVDALSHEFIEDPRVALIQDLQHTISLIAKDTRPAKGTVGNTVTTVYSSYDALLQNGVSQNTWSTVRNAATGTNMLASLTDDTAIRISSGTTSGNWTTITRSGYTFDTSAVGGDTVSDAVFSLYEAGANTIDNFNQGVDIVDFNPDNETSYTTGDFDYNQWGTTPYATIDLTSISTNAYNNFTFNATGRSAINGAGNTVLGTRSSGDTSDTEPTWTGSTTARLYAYYNDQSGTTNDPKLVITHTAAASGPANLKTVNGLAKASIKTINGLAIASIKSINGLT